MSKMLKKRSDERAKPKKVPKTNEGTVFDSSHFEFRGDEGVLLFNIVNDIVYVIVTIVCLRCPVAGWAMVFYLFTDSFLVFQ